MHPARNKWIEPRTVRVGPGSEFEGFASAPFTLSSGTVKTLKASSS
ncbi:hypothetical protein AB0E82_17525 [Streptomyces anulatus]